MASRTAKRNDTAAPCPARRTKSSDKRTDKCPERANSGCEGPSSQPHNQIDEHKEEEVKSKNDKQSTNVPNNEPPQLLALPHPPRRVTRSHIMLPIPTPPPQLPAEPLTPQDHPHTPMDHPPSHPLEEPTLKKQPKALMGQQPGQSLASDISMTAKKGPPKGNQLLVSPFKQYRKSYRKTNKREILSLPYRKCHDPLEGRIVAIINKLDTDKNCLKDLEALTEKMHKMGLKDIMNRFVVAGIRTILNIASQKHMESPVIDRLQQENRSLQLRILEELEDFQSFVVSLQVEGQQEVDCRQYRPQLARKIYKIYRRRYHNLTASSLKAKTLKDCDRLLQQPHSLQKLITFLKEAPFNL